MPIVVEAASYHTDINVVLRMICYTINGSNPTKGYLNRPGHSHCHTVSANWIRNSSSDKELLVLVGITGSRPKVLHSLILSDAAAKRIVSDSFSQGVINATAYTAGKHIYDVIAAYSVSQIKTISEDLTTLDNNLMTIRSIDL